MPHFCGRTHARRDRRDFGVPNGNGRSTLTPPGEAASPTPSHQDVAALAYSYWQARGCPHGSSWEDWLRAERDLNPPA